MAGEAPHGGGGGGGGGQGVIPPNSLKVGGEGGHCPSSIVRFNIRKLLQNLGHTLLLMSLYISASVLQMHHLDTVSSLVVGRKGSEKGHILVCTVSNIHFLKNNCASTTSETQNHKYKGHK